jgi:hypothetical protein
MAVYFNVKLKKGQRSFTFLFLILSIIKKCPLYSMVFILKHFSLDFFYLFWIRIETILLLCWWAQINFACINYSKIGRWNCKQRILLKSLKYNNYILMFYYTNVSNILHCACSSNGGHKILNLMNCPRK